MSTSLAGIDVRSKKRTVYFMDFEETKHISSSFGNNQLDADEFTNMIASRMQGHKNSDIILLFWESTFSCLPLKFSRSTSLTYSVQPQMPPLIASSRKDWFHRCLLHCRLWEGRLYEKAITMAQQFITLKRLTRHRMYLSEIEINNHLNMHSYKMNPNKQNHHNRYSHNLSLRTHFVYTLIPHIRYKSTHFLYKRSRHIR